MCCRLRQPIFRLGLLGVLLFFLHHHEALLTKAAEMNSGSVLEQDVYSSLPAEIHASEFREEAFDDNTAVPIPRTQVDGSNGEAVVEEEGPLERLSRKVLGRFPGLSPTSSAIVVALLVASLALIIKRAVAGQAKRMQEVAPYEPEGAQDEPQGLPEEPQDAPEQPEEALPLVPDFVPSPVPEKPIEAVAADLIARAKAMQQLVPVAESLAEEINTPKARDLMNVLQGHLATAEQAGQEMMKDVPEADQRQHAEEMEQSLQGGLMALSALRQAAREEADVISQETMRLEPLGNWAVSIEKIEGENQYVLACTATLRSFQDLDRELSTRAELAERLLATTGDMKSGQDGGLLRAVSTGFKCLKEVSNARNRMAIAAKDFKAGAMEAAKALYLVECEDSHQWLEADAQFVADLFYAAIDKQRRMGESVSNEKTIELLETVLAAVEKHLDEHGQALQDLRDSTTAEDMGHAHDAALRIEGQLENLLAPLWTRAEEVSDFKEMLVGGSLILDQRANTVARQAARRARGQQKAALGKLQVLEKSIAPMLGDVDGPPGTLKFTPQKLMTDLLHNARDLKKLIESLSVDTNMYLQAVRRYTHIAAGPPAKTTVAAKQAAEGTLEQASEMAGAEQEASLLLQEFKLLEFFELDMQNSLQIVERASQHRSDEGSPQQIQAQQLKQTFDDATAKAQSATTLYDIALAAAAMREAAFTLESAVFNEMTQVAEGR